MQFLQLQIFHKFIYKINANPNKFFYINSSNVNIIMILHANRCQNEFDPQ